MIRQTAVASLERAEKAVTHGTPIEQLLAFMKGYWQLVRSPALGSIYRLHARKSCTSFPDLATFYAHDVSARRLDIISGIIRREMDWGNFREIDPLVAARMLSAMVVQHGISHDQFTGVPLLAHRSDDEVFRELAAFYLYSITDTGGAFAQADRAAPDALQLHLLRQ